MDDFTTWGSDCQPASTAATLESSGKAQVIVRFSCAVASAFAAAICASSMECGPILARKRLIRANSQATGSLRWRFRGAGANARKADKARGEKIFPDVPAAPVSQGRISGQIAPRFAVQLL